MTMFKAGDLFYNNYYNRYAVIVEVINNNTYRLHDIQADYEMRLTDFDLMDDRIILKCNISKKAIEKLKKLYGK